MTRRVTIPSCQGYDLLTIESRRGSGLLRIVARQRHPEPQTTTVYVTTRELLLAIGELNASDDYQTPLRVESHTGGDVTNSTMLMRDDLRVIVKDSDGREYLSLPAVGVVARVPFEIWPMPNDGPPGHGPLYVILVRLPHTPDPDDQEEP